MSKAKIDTKQSIVQAIQSLAHPSNLSQTALSFFEALGYSSERQLPLSNPSYDCFEDSYVKNNFHTTTFKPEKALSTQWKHIDLLFQITPDELKDQLPNFSTQNKDNEIIFSYLFFVLELEQTEYPRSQLSQITREINKLFTIPALILFKHGSNLTLSIIDHRLHKKDESKDVLEKVTLIKDISTKRPHRAHIEILFDLSLPEIIRKYEVSNFVELHQAWQKTLDTKELNLRFYRDLSNWYFWALHEVHFPTNNLEADKNSLLKEEEKVKEHNAKNLIRLLTRLLFVWFIKEKHLIPDELFDERYIKEKLLIDFEPHKIKDFDHKTQGSRFYRAILQNLFFATLNQTVGKREFRKDGQQMNVTNVMRYKQYFKDSSAFIKLLEDVVPFMNGGLFECLDIPDPFLKGKKGGDVILYEDGFSDRKENTLCVPDYIFFGKTEQADLSVDLGDVRQKNVMVDGLINILKNYKFTVTENTPVEEDIALDPELLGRVFENLLASYNPETKSTARKQTGSFYTPREIVNYMVDESLKEYLKQKLVSEAGMKTEDANINLEFLLGYNEKENSFDEIQTSILIKAIDNCKILDPACGSGAFPMGILHKLVHILHKLDPDNKLWKEIQRQKAIKETEEAFQIGNQKERENRLKEISDVFEYNSDDYGRKLFLIENCIYGVDIQPIATQISKLRFFISLIIDQKSEKLRENFGIRPLPNLETKFVAANTLIGVDKSSNQISLFDIPEILQLEVKLKDIRHRIFSAKTPATKRKLREDDQRLREEMCNLLIQFGWGNESARKLSEWDPYNQNLSSGWFDPEWMFGINKGFDIVIGNPPYIKEYTDKNAFDGLRSYKYYQGKMDLWYFFACKSIDFLKDHGNATFIATNNWVTNEGASKLRNKILSETVIRKFIDFRDFMIFDSASIQTMVYLLIKSKKTKYKLDYRRVATEKCTKEVAYELLSKSGNHEYLDLDISPEKFINKRITFVKDGNDQLLEKIKIKANFFLDENKEIAQGIVAPQDSLNRKNAELLNNNLPVGSGIFILSNQEKLSLLLSTQEEQLLRPYFTTVQLTRYYGNKNNSEWIIYTDSSFKNPNSMNPYPNLKKHLDQFLEVITSDNKPYGLHRARDEFFFKGEKIISLRKCSDRPVFTYTNFDCYVSQTFFIIKTNRINQKYLTALMNSKLLTFWLRNKGKMQGNSFQIDKGPLLEIPLHKANDKNCKITSFLVGILLSSIELSISENTRQYFEKILDALFYELYFPDQIKAVDAEVLKYLTNIPEIEGDWSDEKKFHTISEIYEELSNSNHPVSIAMERQKNVEEVRIIEGLVEE